MSPRPDAWPDAWIDALPRDRLIAEFSLWSADLLRLGDEIARIRPHADILHLDVADGHFAPALLFFPDLVAAIRRASPLPIHAHLMLADEVLLAQVEQFADAGCDLISVHARERGVPGRRSTFSSGGAFRPAWCCRSTRRWRRRRASCRGCAS